MNDIYEHSNTRDDIPQAKYIHANRTLSEKHKEVVKKYIADNFNLENSREYNPIDTEAYRILRKAELY